jgi:hypothetical protein
VESNKCDTLSVTVDNNQLVARRSSYGDSLKKFPYKKSIKESILVLESTNAKSTLMALTDEHDYYSSSPFKIDECDEENKKKPPVQKTSTTNIELV